MSQAMPFLYPITIVFRYSMISFVLRGSIMKSIDLISIPYFVCFNRVCHDVFSSEQPVKRCLLLSWPLPQLHGGASLMCSGSGGFLFETMLLYLPI
jgi:hypothetical protein